MIKNDNEVALFIDKYNTFVAILSVDGIQQVNYLNDIFIDWVYLSLMELDTNGIINFEQFNKDGVEKDYPTFIDNYTGKEYDLFEFGYIDQEIILEH